MDRLSRKLLTKRSFVEGLAELGRELDLTTRRVNRLARNALAEMWTRHGPLATAAWNRLGSFYLRNYDVVVDDRRITELTDLDAGHPLVVLFSHRSYLDAWLVREGLHRAGIAPMLTLAGANLDFFPLGPLLRRTGGLFIRRDTKDAPVYRFVLRRYLGHLLSAKRNIGWSIEGGRTRTGKLRPPRFGVLRYVTDAMRGSEGPEAYVLPVSVVYDHLEEVAVMAAEARGANKRPEGLGWAVRYTLQQTQGGVARVDFGEPLPLREHLAKLESGGAGGTAVERVALTVCHRINQVTPPTSTAVVTLALLAGERALTLDEVMDGLEPLRRYLTRHPNLPFDLGEELDDPQWVGDTLGELVETGVVARFDEGLEPVYFIAPDQHLVAAFYRNTLIHLLVVRAIGEFASFLERERTDDVRTAIWQRALQLRELLKFEFFFSRRRIFQDELLAELEIVDPAWEDVASRDGAYPAITHDSARRWLELARPHLAHVVLRPFLDAYRVVADELAAWPPESPVDEAALLERSLRAGRQQVLQRVLHSPESVSLELFRNALILAGHRGLVAETGEAVRRRRADFAREVGELVRELDALAQRQRRTPIGIIDGGTPSSAGAGPRRPETP